MGEALRGLGPLALSRAGLHRRGEDRETPDLLETLLADSSTAVLELVDGKAPILADEPDGEGPVQLVYRSPRRADRDRLVIYLGHDQARGGTAYLASINDGDPDGSEVTREGLRNLGWRLNDLDAAVYTAALAMANWHDTHGFCARCGAPTVPAKAGWLRLCSKDGREDYPRTNPAVIMAITDYADRLLLARGIGFRSRAMSVLAGFVEPGESLAAAVARETFEEVGIEIDQVRQLGDQPWPFPASLMVAFTARALSTELTLQPSEIEEARWFTRDEFQVALAQETIVIPGRISIARGLIERWYGAELAVPETFLRRS